MSRRSTKARRSASRRREIEKILTLDDKSRRDRHLDYYDPWASAA